jgi:uncharacterized protein YjbI with pentapeptide repeats
MLSIKTKANFSQALITLANFSQAQITLANFSQAQITLANFPQAQITLANFGYLVSAICSQRFLSVKLSKKPFNTETICRHLLLSCGNFFFYMS